MELSLGLFFGNQGQIGQPLSEEISLLKCSSRSKQKVLGLVATRVKNLELEFLNYYKKQFRPITSMTELHTPRNFLDSQIKSPNFVFLKLKRTKFNRILQYLCFS